MSVPQIPDLEIQGKVCVYAFGGHHVFENPNFLIILRSDLFRFSRNSAYSVTRTSASGNRSQRLRKKLKGSLLRVLSGFDDL